MKPYRYALLIAGVMLLAACGTEGAGSDTSPPEATPPSTDPNTSESSTTLPQRVPTSTIPPVTGEVPADFLDAVLEDAADRSGINVAVLEVVRSEAVEWPDGSWGCPKPGEVYTQALVSGYWVVIEAAEANYDYRLDDQGNFKLCESGILPPGSGGSATPTTTGSDS